MNENNRIIGEGYSKISGTSAEKFTMFAEVQSQTMVSETLKGCVQIRVGVLPESGTLALDALRENCIGMSIKQAHEFAQRIRAEITEIISDLAEGCSLSGTLLFGREDFMVGLSNSKFLRIPLASCPAIAALTEDKRLDCCNLPDCNGFQWADGTVALTLPELIQKAVNIESSEDGANEWHSEGEADSSTSNSGNKMHSQSKMDTQESHVTKCPYCAEDIQQAAKICKHCGSRLTVEATEALLTNSSSSGHPADQGSGSHANNTIQQQQATDIFAILSFCTGILGFWILPIVFAPICYVCSIVSNYRLKENPNLKGKGLRTIGAILGGLSMLYLFLQLGIIHF